MSVIIFVMLAGARISCGSFSYMTVPVEASISIALGDDKDRVCPEADDAAAGML
jgi:hypothetical protein